MTYNALLAFQCDKERNTKIENISVNTKQETLEIKRKPKTKIKKHDTLTES